MTSHLFLLALLGIAVAQHGRYNRAYSRAPGDYVNDNTNQHYAVRNIQPYGGNANNRGYVEIPATYSQARPTAEWANPPHGRRGVHADLRAMQQRHGFNEASPGYRTGRAYDQRINYEQSRPYRGGQYLANNQGRNYGPQVNYQQHPYQGSRGQHQGVGGGYQQPQYQGSRGQHQVVGGGYQQPQYQGSRGQHQVVGGGYQQPQYQGSRGQHQVVGGGYQQPSYHTAVKLPQLPAVPQLPSLQQTSYETSGHGYQKPTYQASGQQASGYQQPTYQTTGQQASGYQQPAATNQAYSAGAYQQQPQQQYASQPTGQQGQYTAQTGTSQSTYSSPVNQLPRPTSVIVPGVNYRRQEATPYSVAENAAKPTKYTSVLVPGVNYESRDSKRYTASLKPLTVPSGVVIPGLNYGEDEFSAPAKSRALYVDKAMLPVVAGLQTYGETPPPTNYTYAQPAARSYTSGQVGGNSYGGVVQTGTYAAGTAAVSVQESPVQNSYAVEQPPATYVRETSPSSGSVSSYDQLPPSYGSRVSAALPTSYGQTPAQATVSAPHIAGQQYDQAATSYAGPSDQRALLTDVRNSYLADISSGHQVVLPDVNRNVVQRYGSGIDNIIRDIDVTCDPLCRSMDIKIDFTSKLPTKIKLVTPGYNPREKNDNCYFEGGNTERAFFGISLFGCGTTELVNDERQLVQYNNVLKLKLENSGEERQYPIACSISSDERVKMISYLGKLLKDRPKNETGPNIAIPNYCLHLSEVKNKLTDLRAGDSCLLNHQCPPHAMCLPYGGIRICQCSMGWTNYGGRCKSVPRDGDVCYTSEDCKREQASYGCSSGQRVCRIRVEVGGHCMDNAECGPPHRYCRADSNTCACNPNSSAARCSEG